VRGKVTRVFGDRVRSGAGIRHPFFDARSPDSRRPSPRALRYTCEVRRALLGCLGVAWLGLASPVVAQDELTLRWDAPRGCGNEAVVRARLDEVLARPPEGRWEIEGEVRGREGAWQLSLVVRGPNEGRRVVEVAGCDALIQSAAVMIAIAIGGELDDSDPDATGAEDAEPDATRPDPDADPEASDPDASSSPTPDAEPNASSDPDPSSGPDPDEDTPEGDPEDANPGADPDTQPNPDLDDPNSEPDEDRDPNPDAPSSSAEVESTSGPASNGADPEDATRPSASLHALLDTAALPGPTAGASAAVHLTTRRYDLSAGVLALFPRDTENAVGSATLRVLALELRGCAGGTVAALFVGGCAGLEVGRQHGRGAGVDAPQTGTSVWSAATLGARLRAGRRVHLLLDVGVLFPFTRPPFVLDGVEVHRATPAGFRGHLGVGAHFW